MLSISKCITSNIGSYSLISPLSCIKCPSGKYSNEGEEKCINYSGGYFSNEAWKTCQIFETGSYSNEGSPNCLNCPNGIYSNINGPINAINFQLDHGRIHIKHLALIAHKAITPIFSGFQNVVNDKMLLIPISKDDFMSFLSNRKNPK